MAKKIILVGGGGHCKVIIDAIRKSKEFDIIGITDPQLVGQKISGIPVLGNDDELPSLFKEGVKYAFIGVGSVGDCTARKNIDANLNRIGFELPVIVHPKAVVGSDVELGKGTFVAAGAVINPGVKTGMNVIVNTCASIDHDCVMGDFAHIAPGVTLSGGVSVGDETHIGTGANVVQNIKIGKRCMISAGFTVFRDVADESKARLSVAYADEK